MDNSRRTFLKIAGIAAAGLTAAPAVTSLASSASPSKGGKVVRNPEALTAKHWGMVIDTRKLTTSADLEPIIEACHRIHNVPTFEDDLMMPQLPCRMAETESLKQSCEKVNEKIPKISSDKKRHEIKWIWEEEFHNLFPDQLNPYLTEHLEHLPFLTLCNHCANPSCVQACPTKATFQREDGIVLMDFHRCIGCRFCMAACPYGSRSFNFRDPRQGLKEINTAFPTRMKGVVEKCNFCAERLSKGQMPACVEASNGTILFGDLNDPESEVRKALKENYAVRRQPSLGTEPSVYYIL
ncbi:MAG: sulfate reduction electron transfer complex DsrMKJOP subunit DsrO [Thermodesulfobacteriota bacterium]